MNDVIQSINQCDPLQIVIAGMAGQGAVFSATLLAEAAAASGHHVAQTARSSAAVRSGPSIAHVSISSAPIDFPFIENADILVSLTPEEMPAVTVRRDGIILFAPPENNRFGVTDALRVPIAPMSVPASMGLDVTNMVMVGVLTSLLRQLPENRIRERIRTFPRHAIARDLNAFEHGQRAADAMRRQTR